MGSGILGFAVGLAIAVLLILAPVIILGMI
jgi:tetrahydromethanopterin S-methyltransferase subunit F